MQTCLSLIIVVREEEEEAVVVVFFVVVVLVVVVVEGRGGVVPRDLGLFYIVMMIYYLNDV